MLYVAKRGLCLRILKQFPLLQSPRPFFSDHQWRKRTKIYIFSSMIAKEAEGSRLFLKFMRRIVGLRPDFQLPRTAFSNPPFKQLTAFPKNAKPPAHTFIYIDTPARERSRRFTNDICALSTSKRRTPFCGGHIVLRSPPHQDRCGTTEQGRQVCKRTESSEKLSKKMEGKSV